MNYELQEYLASKVTWTGGNVFLNSRVTPNSTAVGTARLPGLTMAAVSSQQVIKMSLPSALGIPPHGHRLVIHGLVTTSSSMRSF